MVQSGTNSYNPGDKIEVSTRELNIFIIDYLSKFKVKLFKYVLNSYYGSLSDKLPSSVTLDKYTGPGDDYILVNIQHGTAATGQWDTVQDFINLVLGTIRVQVDEYKVSEDFNSITKVYSYRLIDSGTKQTSNFTLR